MRHVFQPELLESLKGSLRDLENIKILNPEDIEILRERRNLRQKIDDLEKEHGDGDGNEMAAD